MRFFCAAAALAVLPGRVSAAGSDTKSFADYCFLSRYQSIDVLPVGDGTGKNIKSEVLVKVRSEIRQALKRKGFPVLMGGETAAPGMTLQIEPRLIKYSGGIGSIFGFTEMVAEGDSTEGTGVTLFARLKDKTLDTELGTARVSRGGFSKDGNLLKAADAVADILHTKLLQEEGQTPPPIPVEMGGYSQRSGGRVRLSIQQGSNVAVLSLTSEKDFEAEASIVTDLLRTEVVRIGIGYFNVVDRQYVDKVMAEHAFAASGVTSSEGAAAIGKMLNVQKVITGSLAKSQATTFLTVNMIDVETGRIDSAGSGDYSDTETMKQTVRSLTAQLVQVK
ncbi:MAG: hypothetical protein A2902_01115 [Elusimicrobia bacterium RIFCSPLOWO2_01_FULL_64_13]|nr:MAG: hypothetical protein A2636_03705 [Elusimicrobia bacterium RIFCSPHIGHO2_01_FULL_64_10]OGR97894.1 MAG: hypothetical protein A2902_01115 [Elusimicrobia bacterium RIFCSPLOWO2_01_FULL_64_13]